MIRRRFLADHRSAPGAFYVVAGESVGGAAAELIEDGAYFKKQPASDPELQSVISALEIVPPGAIRYAGTDSTILNRLRALGREDACDAPALSDSREGVIARVCGWIIARIPGPWLQTFGKVIAGRLKAR